MQNNLVEIQDKDLCMLCWEKPNIGCQQGVDGYDRACTSCRKEAEKLLTEIEVENEK